MHFLHEAAIQVYQWGTTPVRWLRTQRWRHTGDVPIAVLYYHRVADSHPNPWTISCRAFSRHIDWLQAHFDIISLSDCQSRLRPHGNHRPAVSITFDDGYAENSQFAIPLLVERGIPFTYFVTLQHILSGHPFPHDVARGVPLPVDTPEMIRGLATAGVEIGGHTRTHTDLGQVTDAEVLYDEIVAASIELSDLIEQPVRYFAFPFGQMRHLNRLGAKLARQHGIQGVCSAYGGYNFPGDDPFHLQRIHGDPSLVRIQNWLSFDRRIARIQRFQFEADEADTPLECRS